MAIITRELFQKGCLFKMGEETSITERNLLYHFRFKMIK